MVSSGMLRRVARRLLVAASVVPSSPIPVTLMKEVLGSSETSVLTEPHGGEQGTTLAVTIRLTLFLVHRFLSP
jgi:hypothetical protein